MNYFKNKNTKITNYFFIKLLLMWEEINKCNLKIIIDNNLKINKNSFNNLYFFVLLVIFD